MFNLKMGNFPKNALLSVCALSVVMMLAGPTGPVHQPADKSVVCSENRVKTEAKNETNQDISNTNDGVKEVKNEKNNIKTPSGGQLNKQETLIKLREHCLSASVHPGVNNAVIQKYVKHFKQSKCEKTWVNKPEVKLQLDYILTQLEKRDLPGELALIPMIESNFKKEARSHKGAVGLWQFMPKTGRALGLNCNAKNDARKDVKASTNAALDYLEYLHKRFNKDWMLALAAYNAGEGTVARAISRNKRQGKAVSFWSLKLPYETTQYVPKILGVIQYVKQLN